jgi:hypothetical protein
MPLPSPRCCLVLATAFAGSLPGQTMANDRDLKATHIPAASCVPLGMGEGQWIDDGLGGGWGIYGYPNRFMELRCALPLNNVDLGGTTNDNDISSFTVLYRDGDGRGGGSNVYVTLKEVVLTNGLFQVNDRCTWFSSTNGGTSAGGQSSSFPCAVDLSATAMYYFDVSMQNGIQYADEDAVATLFVGIRFP